MVVAEILGCVFFIMSIRAIRIEKFAEPIGVPK